ncbi:unnamed protein product [Mucor hiemalis]
MTKTELEVLQVQTHRDKHDMEHNTLSMECNNNKMLLGQDPDTMRKEGDVEEETLSTEDDKDSSDDDTGSEQSEIIQLQDSEEDDDYEMMLSRPAGYKKMELKGESESDKDLIIYSLNESLQIHKEIVERIQNEKDDLEDQYEQEKAKEWNEFEEDKNEIESKKEIIVNQVNKLELICQNLLNELEVKKLEYRRMETRFYSHIKSIRSSEDDLSTIYPQYIQLFSQIHNFSTSIKSKLSNKNNILEYWWNKDSIVNQSIQHHLSSLDVDMIVLLTEKIFTEVIVHEILQTSIHPGVSLNNSFGEIHHWVEKRNTSWATRMKQQIASFVVKQSNEENDQIETAKEEIINKVLTLLSQVYNDTDKMKRKVTSIVNLATKLNLAVKCQENEVVIDSFEEGGVTMFDENTMVSIENNTGDSLLLVITPQIVALGDHGFNIPAKVYCV